MKFKFIVLQGTAICIDEIKYMTWSGNFGVIREEGEPLASINVFFKDGSDMNIPYSSHDEYDASRNDALQKMGLIDENYEWICK